MLSLFTTVMNEWNNVRACEIKIRLHRDSQVVQGGLGVPWVPTNRGVPVRRRENGLTVLWKAIGSICWIQNTFLHHDALQVYAYEGPYLPDEPTINILHEHKSSGRASIAILLMLRLSNSALNSIAVPHWDSNEKPTSRAPPAGQSMPLQLGFSLQGSLICVLGCIAITLSSALKQSALT